MLHLQDVHLLKYFMERRQRYSSTSELKQLYLPTTNVHVAEYLTFVIWPRKYISLIISITTTSVISVYHNGWERNITVINTNVLKFLKDL